MYVPQSPSALRDGMRRKVLLFMLMIFNIEAYAQHEEVNMRTSQPIRASLAGSWYSNVAETLRQELEGYLEAAGKPVVTNPVIALISPHAGYAFSGAVAAKGLRQLQHQSIRRVIVMGNVHRVALSNKLSVPMASAFETPLGSVPIDTDFVVKLHQCPLFTDYRPATDGENSVEMQLPLLQTALGAFKLVPIYVGQCDATTLHAAGTHLRQFVDTNTIVIASTDFTHYGNAFQYTPFHSRIEENIKALDLGALREIENKNAEGLLAYIQRTGATICGHDPVALLLTMLPPQAKAHLLAYTTSGALTGDFTHSVSYASMAFTGTWEEPEIENMGTADFTEKDKQALLALARETLSYYLKNHTPPTPTDIKATISPAMCRKMGVFVTLHSKGELRGCIGEILPQRELWRAVMARAIDAGMHDTRFNPVTTSELPDIDFEISVLTPPMPVASYNDIVIGHHGMVLEKDGKGAVFLPQVALEQGWDLSTTLSYLARKAGLPADAWRQGARFTVFEAIVFGEKK